MIFLVEAHLALELQIAVLLSLNIVFKGGNGIGIDGILCIDTHTDGLFTFFVLRKVDARGERIHQILSLFDDRLASLHPCYCGIGRTEVDTIVYFYS